CFGTRAAWGLRASYRSGRTSPTDRDGNGPGSRSRTRLMSAAAPPTHQMDDERRRELLDATLAALEYTVGRDEHLPLLRELVESRAGPVTFAELPKPLPEAT